MSLINDALKRATQAQSAAKPAPEMETDMKPAPPPPRTVGLPVYFMPVLLFLVSGACWFLVKGWDVRKQNIAAQDPIVALAREPQDLPPAEGAELPVPENRQFALNDAPTSAASGASAAPSTATIEPAAAAPVSVEPAASGSFKLQGIFYRPTNPSAVVNSKTVYVGDIIANARVKAIDHQSVTLVLGNETKVLTMQ